jgi:hypothetical protein
MGRGDGDGLTGEVVLDVNLDGLLIDLLTRRLKDEIELAKVREVAEEPAEFIRAHFPVEVVPFGEAGHILVKVKTTEIAGVRRAIGVPVTVLECDLVDVLEVLSKVVEIEICRAQHI